jgi:hypothetical protein
MINHTHVRLQASCCILLGVVANLCSNLVRLVLHGIGNSILIRIHTIVVAPVGSGS